MFTSEYNYNFTTITSALWVYMYNSTAVHILDQLLTLANKRK